MLQCVRKKCHFFPSRYRDDVHVTSLYAIFFFFGRGIFNKDRYRMVEAYYHTFLKIGQQIL